MKMAADEKNEADNWRPWTFSNSKNSHEARISILAMNYQMMGNLWGALGEKEKQRYSFGEAIKLGESINNGKVIFLGYASLAAVSPPDSAIMFTSKGLQFAAAAGFRRTGNTLINLAKAYAGKGMWDSAFIFAYNSIAINLADNYLRSLVSSYVGVSIYSAGKTIKIQACFMRIKL
ncbi:MAG: hypothetical protein IPO42_03265 [Chitinophagaceae bacterium]|nr:hypothetical protein [Chitinophagaceae bacterium]